MEERKAVKFIRGNSKKYASLKLNISITSIDLYNPVAKGSIIWSEVWPPEALKWMTNWRNG